MLYSCSTKSSDSGSLVYHGDSLLNMDLLPIKRLPLSMLEILDTSNFPPGKRLLRQWLSKPLTDCTDILRRQESIKALETMGSKTRDARKMFKLVGDLQKKLQYVYQLSVEKDPNSADARAIIYDEKKVKRCFDQLPNVIESIKTALEVLRLFREGQETALESVLLSVEDENEIDELCEKFDAIGECKNEVPYGFSKEFDEAKSALLNHQQEVDGYLKKQRAKFGRDLKFWGSGNSMYQLEVPDRITMPETYSLSSQRKGFKRYVTEEICEMRECFTSLEEKMKATLDEACVNVMKDFAKHKNSWEKLNSTLAVLDALMCLQRYSFKEMDGWTFPVLKVEPQDLQIRNGRHPILIEMAGNSHFISNSITLQSEKLAILTGPNMGGKSTIMRQTGLLVVLAQLGCRVPADEMVMCPFQSIFTRMGARDGIFEGESTFFVELSETVEILRNANSRSLVLIDELGRGTSTHDGCAIALATINYLAGKCFSIFSTHYHEMIKMLQASKQRADMVKIYRMGIMEPTPTRPLTYLYKLEDGECSLSHGFNTARLAGLPHSVLKVARSKSDLVFGKI